MGFYTKILSQTCRNARFYSFNLFDGNKVYWLKQPISRNLFNMSSPKIQKSGTYISIKMPKGATSKSGALTLFLRRCSTKRSTTSKLSKADITRLLSLAKPERWKLMGNFLVIEIAQSF